MKNKPKNIIDLTKVAIAGVEGARKARWELGVALLAEFYTKQDGVWMPNSRLDKDARTVKDEATANAKRVGKTVDALNVFYNEAVSFAKKHKTVEAAIKNNIKRQAAKPKRFSSKKSAQSTIDRLGERNARALALAILEVTGK
jgi:uncharacterized protein YdaU (DUF1376 family)